MATTPNKRKGNFKSVVDAASLAGTLTGGSLAPTPDAIPTRASSPAGAITQNSVPTITVNTGKAPQPSLATRQVQPMAAAAPSQAVTPADATAAAPAAQAPAHIGDMVASQLAANPDDPELQALAQSHARLTDILNSVPNVDYAGKYNALIQQAQAQPVVKAPGQAQSFFAALGSPASAPELLAQARSQEQQSRAQKLQELFGLKEQAIRGGIEQSLAKGDFKKALALSELAHEHAIEQSKLSDERWMGHRDRIEQNQRDMFALASGESRARTEAQIKQSDLHLDQQESANFAEAVTRATDAEAAKLDNDPMRMGRPVSPEERETIRVQQFALLARTLAQAGQLKPGTAAPATTAGAGALAPGNVRMRRPSDGKVFEFDKAHADSAKANGWTEVK